MNLVKHIKEIEINNKKYYMTFDMRSIQVFKQLTGKSFLQSVADLGSLDDNVVIGLIGATIRETENGNPLGGKIINEIGVVGLLLALSEDVITLVTDSMPQSENGETVKK